MRWQVAASDVLLLFCGIQSENNKKETFSETKVKKNVKQHAATQTHKEERLHAAVHAHRIGDRSGTIVTDLIAGL